jgi:hypothetical protein
MKITETQLKELIQEELILNEIWGQIAQGGMAALSTGGGRKAIAAILRLPDTLLKKLSGLQRSTIEKAAESQGIEVPEFVHTLGGLHRHTSGASAMSALADFIEGMDDKEMAGVLSAAAAAKGAPALTPPTPGGPPALSVVGGTDVAVENLTHLTTERFKQIVQEELALTTQMERKLK